jgi:hypothetical protein
VETAVDSRTIERKPDRASFLVALPYLAERSEFVTFERRILTGGAEDDADIVAAGAVDRVP